MISINKQIIYFEINHLLFWGQKNSQQQNCKKDLSCIFLILEFFSFLYYSLFEIATATITLAQSELFMETNFPQKYRKKSRCADTFLSLSKASKYPIQKRQHIHSFYFCHILLLNITIANHVILLAIERELDGQASMVIRYQTYYQPPRYVLFQFVHDRARIKYRLYPYLQGITLAQRARMILLVTCLDDCSAAGCAKWSNGLGAFFPTFLVYKYTYELTRLRLCNCLS